MIKSYETFTKSFQGSKPTWIPAFLSLNMVRVCVSLTSISARGGSRNFETGVHKMSRVLPYLVLRVGAVEVQGRDGAKPYKLERDNGLDSG